MCGLWRQVHLAQISVLTLCMGTARLYLLSCKLGTVTDPSQMAAGKTGGLSHGKGLAPSLEHRAGVSEQAVTIPSSTAVPRRP